MKFKTLVFVTGVGVMMSSMFHGVFIGSNAGDSVKVFSLAITWLFMAAFGYFIGRIREV